LHWVAVCCSVLQCVAVCCSVLQCVAVCCSVMQRVVTYCNVLLCFADSRSTTVARHGSQNTLRTTALSLSLSHTHSLTPLEGIYLTPCTPPPPCPLFHSSKHDRHAKASHCNLRRRKKCSSQTPPYETTQSVLHEQHALQLPSRTAPNASTLPGSDASPAACSQNFISAVQTPQHAAASAAAQHGVCSRGIWANPID